MIRLVQLSNDCEAVLRLIKNFTTQETPESSTVRDFASEPHWLFVKLLIGVVADGCCTVTRSCVCPASFGPGCCGHLVAPWDQPRPAFPYRLLLVSSTNNSRIRTKRGQPSAAKRWPALSELTVLLSSLEPTLLMWIRALTMYLLTVIVVKSSSHAEIRTCLGCADLQETFMHAFVV